MAQSQKYRPVFLRELSLAQQTISRGLPKMNRCQSAIVALLLQWESDPNRHHFRESLLKGSSHSQKESNRLRLLTSPLANLLLTLSFRRRAAVLFGDEHRRGSSSVLTVGLILVRRLNKHDPLGFLRM